MQTSSDKIIQVSQLPIEKQIEKERVHDILLLLQHLVEREEVTVRIILDCLYDIGSVNLINNKFRARSLSGMLKWVTRLSRPAFRVVALRWFKRNCPQLITNWLYDQVKFAPKQSPAALEIEVESQRVLENNTIELKRLRSQVRLLTGMLIATITLFGGTVIWFGYTSQAGLESPILSIFDKFP
ncbi:MAG: hypothetical protein ACOC0N_11565 [Chroococcales cyanobacterium]